MKKILIIEDEASVRTNLMELVEEEGYQPIGAENGLIGVGLAQSDLPDLIICDVMMPELNGYEVLNVLHQSATTSSIPFIFLTAKADRASLREGMELGADDYLTKPFTRAEVLNAISTRLEKRGLIEQHAEQKLENLRANLALSLPHELNTPLSIILMYSELLLEQGNRLQWEQMRPQLEKINSNAARLQRLIQNFLLYAKLEVAATDPEQIKALRANTSGSTKELITATARHKAKQIGRDSDLELELQEAAAQISGQNFKKVVEELVDNAFRYSSAKTPVKIISVVNNHDLVLEIIDNGRGLSAEQLIQIGAYSQFERKVYEQQGTGLGLAIARRLVELHKGQLNVESVSGKKTVVRVNLPLQATTT